MKKVKFIVKDKNTLELVEDGSKGDILDLSEEMTVDTTGIEETLERGIDLARDTVYSKRLAQEKETLRAKAEEDKVRTTAELSAKIKDLESQIKTNKALDEAALKAKELELKTKYENQIIELTGKLDKAKAESELSITKALAKKEEELRGKDSEILKLNSTIETNEAKSKLEKNVLEESYKEKLKFKEEEVAYYKDLKSKMSTKMIGETLEQHCYNEFNRVRSYAFPNAYFEKDNDVVEGFKGDFVFKEENNGVELLSIMFEMKNEMDTTATKHKNEDFLDKLDKDRKKKNCEYAVLVTMLEADNELYNEGIVDVSHKYPKMYIIRPQYFLPLIGLLRNAAMNSLQYKKELVEMKNQNIDVSNFENSMLDFQEKFGRNYRLASEKFQKAIEEIDKSIDHLNKIKEALISSENNLRLANDKAQDLSIKKLTRNNPTMKQMFEDVKKEQE